LFILIIIQLWWMHNMCLYFVRAQYVMRKQLACWEHVQGFNSR